MEASTIQWITIGSVFLGSAVTIWSFGKKSGELKTKVDNNASDTQQIKTGMETLTEQNSDAHRTIHGRFDTLPCSDHAKEIGHLKGRMNGRAEIEASDV